MNFIDKLQNKPRGVRVVIMWVSSAVVMIIIIIIWLFSFSKNVSNKNNNGLEQTKLPSLFETLKQDFSTLKQGLNANLKDIKSTTQKIENLDQTNSQNNEGQ